MKRVCLTITFLMAVCYWSQGQVNSNTATLTKPQQELWNKVLDFQKAVFGTKDSAVIDGLVSTQLHYGHSAGSIEDKTAMVHNASNSKTIYENVTNDFISMNMVGNVAMVRVGLKATSIEKGTPTPLDLGILQVWAKEKGNWKLLERQAVKRNVK